MVSFLLSDRVSEGEGQEQLLSPPKVAVSARNSKAEEMSC